MKKKLSTAVLFYLFLVAGFVNAKEFYPLTGVIHVQTSFDGAGAYSLRELMTMAKQKNIAFFEYPATRIKKAMTGSGHASKLQIQKMVEHTLGAPEESFGSADITDALSLAIAHAYLTRSRR